MIFSSHLFCACTQSFQLSALKMNEIFCFNCVKGKYQVFQCKSLWISPTNTTLQNTENTSCNIQNTVKVANVEVQMLVLLQLIGFDAAKRIYHVREVWKGEEPALENTLLATLRNSYLL